MCFLAYNEQGVEEDEIVAWLGEWNFKLVADGYAELTRRAHRLDLDDEVIFTQEHEKKILEL